MAIFPINVEGIRYATAQLVARRDGKVYLMQIDGIPTTIALQGGKTLKNVKAKGLSTPISRNLYLLTREQAEHLFLDPTLSSPSPSATPLQFTKLRDAGQLRTIVKGKAKVAEAPSEQDWQQAAVYRIDLTAVPAALSHPILSITYQGDCARLYADGKLVADNFQYGRPFLFGLWRMPAGVTSLELRILPLQPDAPIYLPREADKTAGEGVKQVTVAARE
jgi:hypothetical protein